MATKAMLTPFEPLALALPLLSARHPALNRTRFAVAEISNRVWLV